MEDTTKTNIMLVLSVLVLIGVAYIVYRVSTPRAFAYGNGKTVAQFQQNRGNRQHMMGSGRQSNFQGRGQKQGMRNGMGNGQHNNPDCPYYNKNAQTDTVQ